jgi:hypothetical protein
MVATIGFSMGAQEWLIANLNDPEEMSATVMIYRFGFDKIATKRLKRRKSPVLVIAGAAKILAQLRQQSIFSPV